MTPGPLDGVRVLDFASVGPGARASRILSDYGAEVIKLAPTPSDGTKQIVPPFYAYSGHRLQKRALFDLKAEPGEKTNVADKEPYALQMMSDAFWMLRTWNKDWRKSDWGNALNVTPAFADAVEK